MIVTPKEGGIVESHLQSLGIYPVNNLGAQPYKYILYFAGISYITMDDEEYFNRYPKEYIISFQEFMSIFRKDKLVKLNKITKNGKN